MVARHYRQVYKNRQVALEKADSEDIPKIVGDEVDKLGLGVEGLTRQQRYSAVMEVLSQRETQNARHFAIAIVVFLFVAFIVVLGMLSKPAPSTDASKHVSMPAPRLEGLSAELSALSPNAPAVKLYVGSSATRAQRRVVDEFVRLVEQAGIRSWAAGTIDQMAGSTPPPISRSYRAESEAFAQRLRVWLEQTFKTRVHATQFAQVQPGTVELTIEGEPIFSENGLQRLE
jgi:hypothetical protein